MDLDASRDGNDAWKKITGIKFSCGSLLDNITAEDIEKVRIHHLLRWQQYKDGFYPGLAPKEKRPKHPLGMAFFAVDHIYSKKRS